MDSPAAARYQIPMQYDDELDARGLLCPLPVLKARKRLMALPVGGTLRMLADDPAAVIDVPHYCNESGNELVSASEAQDHQIYVLRKT